MEVPILRQGRYLIATVQTELTDADLLKLRDELATRVGQHRSRGVVLDVSLLDVIDSYSARMLRGIAQSARLRGAETVVVGIQPDVALAMVQLGLTLDDVTTALDLDEGLAVLAGGESEARSDRGQ